MCVRVCVRGYVRACVRACVCMCVCLCLKMQSPVTEQYVKLYIRDHSRLFSSSKDQDHCRVTVKNKIYFTDNSDWDFTQ